MPKVFDKAQMEVNRLDYSGSKEEPQARIHLRLPLTSEIINQLNIKKVLEAKEINFDKPVHLHPGPLDFGDVFKIRIATLNEDGFEDVAYDTRNASLVSATARNVKDIPHLVFSILLPLPGGATFWDYVDMKDGMVEVTITPGVKQTELGV